MRINKNQTNKYTSLPEQSKVDPRRAQKASYIQYGVENGELMHECFPKHLRIGASILN